MVTARQAGTQAKQDASLGALNTIEQDMYRQIGMSQLSTERDIAKRRMQSLRSGMSSGQMAAQEMQNILAAQTGAQQIARNYEQQRMGLMTEFAGQKEMNEAYALKDLMDLNMQQQQINAQNNTAQLSAYSQMFSNSIPMQNEAQYGAAYTRLSTEDRAIFDMVTSGVIASDDKRAKDVMGKMGFATPEEADKGLGASWEKGLLPGLADTLSSGVAWALGFKDNELWKSGVQNTYRK